MNRNGQTSPTEGVRSGVSGLLHDVTSLAELQFELLKVDAANASRKAAVPAVLIGSAVVLALSTIPLVLVAIAQLFRDQAGWPPVLATLTAVLIGLVLAGVAGMLGYFGMRRAIEPLDRSRDELNRNITWLKSALRRHSAGTSGEANDRTGYPLAPR